uniref:Uncharacterized protein n=1 Tax=Tanacetum cinerariifolium TaxID=118510 RepID=A0A6L2M1P3_TANCI|nr:hypothetical protein [Tanacetum cinerariifolium]
MASSLVKRVASSLKRVRAIASSSRFFNIKGFEYDQFINGDISISNSQFRGNLVDSKSQGSSSYRSLFDPRLSPTRNLARLLTVTDGMIGYKYGIHVMTKWSVAGDDKALYLLCDMPSPKFLAGLHKDDVDEDEGSVPQEEFIFGISARETNMSPLLHLMRGVKREPSEYYYHVMQDAKELVKLSESAGGTQYALCICLHVSYKLQNPQAIRTGMLRAEMAEIPRAGMLTTLLEVMQLRFFYQKGSSVSRMSRRIKRVSHGR